jgi:hypothetical protein
VALGATARRVRGLGSAVVSPAATFILVRGLAGALAGAVAIAWVALVLARAVRRDAGLIGIPLPGRIVRAGIRATGWDNTS